MIETENRSTLRMPADMARRLAERAKENRRSMNSEIVVILANVLGNQGTTTTGPGLEGQRPVVVSEQTARQGGVLSTQAMEQPK